MLAQLLDDVQGISPQIFAHSLPREELVSVELRMHVSARHVAATQLGAYLHRSPNALSAYATAATVETAARTIIFGSGMASIDLCASALLRWHERQPADPDRDFDFEDLRTQRQHIPLTPAQDDWYRSVSGSHHYRQLREFRGAALHRIIRQSVAINPGGQHQRWISPSTDLAPTTDADDLADRVARFVLDCWRRFWPALVA